MNKGILRAQPIDIMLTDYSMPEMNGVELIRETRKAHPNLIIFMITAYSSEYFGKYGAEEGVQKVLAKPVSRNSLLTHLSSALPTS
jgi:two-component system response regulator YesN